MPRKKKQEAEPSCQTIRYRDLDGFIIESKKPIWGVTKASDGYRVARYIWCPETEGLRYIGHCEACRFFAGHELYQGVRCTTNKPYNLGNYPSRTK